MSWRERARLETALADWRASSQDCGRKFELVIEKISTGAYEGLEAASRASLSLLPRFPVEASLRWVLCELPVLVLVWTGGGLGRASGRLARAESGGRGMGLTLAAAMERESRLSAAASFCTTVSTMGGQKEGEDVHP